MAANPSTPNTPVPAERSDDLVAVRASATDGPATAEAVAIGAPSVPMDPQCPPADGMPRPGYRNQPIAMTQTRLWASNVLSSPAERAAGSACANAVVPVPSAAVAPPINAVDADRGNAPPLPQHDVPEPGRNGVLWSAPRTITMTELIPSVRRSLSRMGIPISPHELRLIFREYHAHIANGIIDHHAVYLHGLGTIYCENSRPARRTRVFEVDEENVVRILEPNNGFAYCHFQAQRVFLDRARLDVRQHGFRLTPFYGPPRRPGPY
jgi:hypothetical protein